MVKRMESSEVPSGACIRKPWLKHWKYNLRQCVSHVKNLQGNPHYVAMGMAIGVFVGVTPTFPFHTALAVLLAFVLRGSKPAAAIGVWFGNPVTMPFFYLASYRLGMFFLGRPSPFDEKYESILELLNLGMDVTVAMLVGGAIIGIPPAVAAYVITSTLIRKIREKARARNRPKDR